MVKFLMPYFLLPKCQPPCMIANSITVECLVDKDHSLIFEICSSIVKRQGWTKSHDYRLCEDDASNSQ